MKKNAFFTFCCACVPGCGQMYQGYMKRGVSLLFWFAAVAAFVTTTRVLGVGALMFVIWAYSFFDTFNLRNLSPEQRALFEDNFIPNPQGLGIKGLDALTDNIRFAKLAGWGCIVVGALILITNLYNALVNLLYSFAPAIAGWLEYAGGMVVALAIGAAIVMLGLRLLRGPKTAARDEDDIPEFKGDDYL
ncbi:hypothetical protein LJC60_03320 [Ruminococcaceae bacterium OttesenSCG-928-D13]|nr:hypothetical protein [Ruminococcaceae bacterium OttesenSCG-928-D13]